MTFKISLTPWHVDMDYILDATNDRVLRVLPQGDFKDGDFIEDEERARYNLQLASCAPELLVALQSIVEHGTDSPEHNAALAIIARATTVDFQDGNIAYRQLANDKLNKP